MCYSYVIFFFFFFNDTATTEIYTLSLHDALPIFLLDEAGELELRHELVVDGAPDLPFLRIGQIWSAIDNKLMPQRSEEHTSELQSQSNLVCRLLLEKKNKQHETH